MRPVSQNVQPFEERGYVASRSEKRGREREKEREKRREWMQTSGFRDRRAVLYDLVRCQRNLHDLQPNRRCVNHVDQPMFFHLLYKYGLAHERWDAGKSRHVSTGRGRGARTEVVVVVVVVVEVRKRNER